jgi:hypothetical protein
VAIPWDITVFASCYSCYCRVFMNALSRLEGWHGCVLAISACLAGRPHFCVISLALTSQLISIFFSPATFSEYGYVVWLVHFLFFNSLARLDPNLLGHDNTANRKKSEKTMPRSVSQAKKKAVLECCLHGATCVSHTRIMARCVSRTRLVPCTMRTYVWR